MTFSHPLSASNSMTLNTNNEDAIVLISVCFGLLKIGIEVLFGSHICNAIGN
jgi:hypothetical protein